MKTLLLAAAVLPVLGISSASFAAPPQYTITALDTPAGALSQANGVSTAGAVGTVEADTTTPALWTGSGRLDLEIPEGFFRGFASAVNNAGLVVGTVGAFGPATRGVTWTNGTATLLPIEDNDADKTETQFGAMASAVNDGGTIVGRGVNQYGETGIVWKPDGDLQILMGLTPVEDVQNSWAQGINIDGLIVGFATNSEGRDRAVRWNGNTPVSLGAFFDEGNSYAHAVNDAGTIVGWGTTEDEFGSAFVFSNNTMTELDRLTGADYGEAFDINNSGFIVGQSLESGIEGRGFATLWLDGQVFDLETLLANDPTGSWQLLGAASIDEAGRIVGFGVHNGEIAAYMLSPVPEPAAIALLALLPIFVAGRRRVNT